MVLNGDGTWSPAPVPNSGITVTSLTVPSVISDVKYWSSGSYTLTVNLESGADHWHWSGENGRGGRVLTGNTVSFGSNFNTTSEISVGSNITVSSVNSSHQVLRTQTIRILGNQGRNQPTFEVVSTT